MATIEDDLQNLKLRLEMMEGEKKSVENEHKIIAKQHEKQVEKFKQTNLALKQLITESSKNAVRDIQHEDELHVRKKQDLLNFKIHSEKKQNQELMKEKKVLIDISSKNNKEIEGDIDLLRQKTNLAIIKSQEADSLRKSYEKLLSSFQDDRNTFDIRMKKLEEAITKKKLELHGVGQNLLDSNLSKEQWKKSTETNERQIEDSRRFREETLNSKKDEFHSLVVVDDEDNLLTEKDEAQFLDFNAELRSEEDVDIALYRNQRIFELAAIAESVKNELLVETVADLRKLVNKKSDQMKILNSILDGREKKNTEVAPKSCEFLADTKSVGEDLPVIKSLEIVSELESEYNRFIKLICKKSERLQSSKQKMMADFSYDPLLKSFEDKLCQLVLFLPKKDLEIEVDITAICSLLQSQNQRIEFKKKPLTAFIPVQNDDVFVPNREFLKKQSALMISQTKQKITKRKK